MDSPISKTLHTFGSHRTSSVPSTLKSGSSSRAGMKLFLVMKLTMVLSL